MDAGTTNSLQSFKGSAVNSREESPKPLRELRVLEVGNCEASAYCGMLFAQGGAEVSRVGSDARAEVASSTWATVRSAYLNSGKREVLLPQSDIHHLVTLAGENDVVIAGADFPWDEIEKLPHPQPVSVLITPFGRGGPHDEWLGTELVLASRGGATEYTVDEHGTPVYGHGRRFQYLAGTYAFVTALALLHDRSPTSELTHPRVEVSMLETVVSMLGYPTTQYSYNGTSGVTGQAGPRYTLRCSDGYIVLGANGNWPPIAAMIGRPDLAEDPRFVTQGQRFEHAGELGKMVEAWAAQSTIAEAVQQAEDLSVPLVALATGEDLVTDEHLAGRDAWEVIEVPGIGAGKAPRAPYIIDGQRVGRNS
jgi:crotonobetainyl-CoA:carnitine CoA-transferase CaiB-like acyl-CoA transferase